MPQAWKCCPLGAYIRWNSLVRDFPQKAFVLRWRRDATIKRKEAQVGPSHHLPRRALPRDRGTEKLLELPQKRGRPPDPEDDAEEGAEAAEKGELDPYRLLDAVQFSLKLRQVEEYSDALDIANRILHPAFDDPPPRDRSSDPSRPKIERSKVKLGMVGMALERRTFAQEMLEDAVESIHGYTDSSPVVGEEIQGMLCDIMKRDGSLRRVHFPSSTLHYGRYDSVNKAICFIWGIWLVCGPTMAAMKYFLEKTYSFTTDFGNEASTGLLPDILDAFVLVDRARVS